MVSHEIKVIISVWRDLYIHCTTFTCYVAINIFSLFFFKFLYGLSSTAFNCPRWTKPSSEKGGFGLLYTLYQMLIYIREYL